MVEIKEDDIQSEVKFWKHTVIFYVLGTCPPFAVLDGFIKQYWGKLGINETILAYVCKI